MSRGSKKYKIIVILGPTSSGKSELAVKIAKKFNGEIISADSRQVYKGLNIGAGKVPRDKNPKSEIRNSKQILNSKFKIQNSYFYYKKIRHHLIDVASPKRNFSVAQYQKLAKRAIKEILKQDKLPIICGGTGFYIDALIYNYLLPAVPAQKALREKLEKENTESLYKKLRELDPRRAKNIDKHNKRRLMRALEIVLTTDKPVPILRKRETQYNVLKIGIKKSPEELKKLISRRLKKRLREGMLGEVKKLHENGLSWKRLDDLGLEYRHISRYLRGLFSKKEMIAILEKEICKYAKRQMTWFKKDNDICWVKDYKEAEKLARQFFF